MSGALLFGLGETFPCTDDSVFSPGGIFFTEACILHSLLLLVVDKSGFCSEETMSASSSGSCWGPARFSSLEMFSNNH